MEDTYFGFKTGELLVALIRTLKQKGVLTEEEALDMLWNAKESMFPWSKQEIKELIKL